MPCRFSKEKVQSQIERHFPSCPTERAAEIVSRVAEKEWADASIYQAIFSMAEAHIRHNLTSYEWDLAQGGLDKETAREKAKPAIRWIIKKWKSPIEG